MTTLTQAEKDARDFRHFEEGFSRGAEVRVTFQDGREPLLAYEVKKVECLRSPEGGVAVLTDGTGYKMLMGDPARLVKEFVKRGLVVLRAEVPPPMIVGVPVPTPAQAVRVVKVVEARDAQGDIVRIVEEHHPLPEAEKGGEP